MKKIAKKRPNPFVPGKRMAPATLPTEGKAVDVERKDLKEGTSAEERFDIKQSARKSGPRVI